MSFLVCVVVHCYKLVEYRAAICLYGVFDLGIFDIVFLFFPAEFVLLKTHFDLYT